MQEENVVRENKSSKLDKYVIILLAIIILDLQFFGTFGRTTFFEDFTIIFEGGYLISSGQIPYTDFFMPVGPMVFLIQGFFQIIFGSNLFAMAFHSFTLAIILCIIFYYFVRKEFGIAMSFIFGLFFYLSFNGLTFHPWYDYVAYFFFFINIFILLKYYKQESLPWFVYSLSALFSTLSFYSKQDVGLLQIFFILIFFIFNYHKKLKSIILFYVLPLIVLIGSIYLIFSNFTTGFQYWFNLGQYPHSARFSNFFLPAKFLNIITSWKLYISLFFVYKILLNKIKKKDFDSIKLMCLFVIVAVTSLITQVTSGNFRQTLAIGIPVLIFILYLLIKDNIKELIKNHKTIISLIIVIFLLLSVNPFPTYGLAALNYVDSDLGRIDKGCYSGALLSQTALEGLTTIRKTIEENENSFISFTHYQFLYCDYNVARPKGLPLWFYEGITIFDDNVEDILETTKSFSPKVILLHFRGSPANIALNKKFEDRFYEMGYTKTDTVDTMASSIPLSIFVKEESKT